MIRSISQRFTFSLIANLLRAIMSFATGMLVARGLGPENYGLMMFLLGTFVAVQQLFDMGTSTAFFTFLSGKNQSWKFVGWYFAWLTMQFLVPLFCIGIFFPDLWLETIWQGETRSIITLAFLAAFLQNTLWTAVLRMGESKRLTFLVQGVGLTIASVHLCVMVVGFWKDWLDVHNIFMISCVEWLVANVIVIKSLSFESPSNEADGFKNVFAKYWEFCLPLIPYAWISFVYEFADRWLLQNFGGNSQQAYYAVANQLSMIVAVVTASIVNIFWKEIAEADEQKNHELVRLYYFKVTRGLFFFCSAVAAFLAPWSREIIQVILGEEYISGVMTVAIMFFYPIYQTMWEITTVVAIATKRVLLQVSVGAFFKISSIFVAYYVLSPTDGAMPGLGLGATGLAVKMVAMQFLVANIFGYFIARSLRIKFHWLFQPVTLIFCGASGLFAYWASHRLFDFSDSLVSAVVISATIYLILILIPIIIAPRLVGMERSDIVRVQQYVSSKLRSDHDRLD